MKSTFSIIVSLFMLLEHSYSNPINTKAAVATEFIILHNNDMHARFEQTSKDSSKCQLKDAESSTCYGGFARVAHEVRKFRQVARNGGTPVLYLNAGDTYTGTPWFTIFKDNITAAFLNLLKPDAISLGNHEFDENVEGLVPFLNEVDFPVLACNLDLTKVPEISAAKKFAHSTVLKINGTNVGIVGYLTPDTKFLVPQNAVEYKPEIKSINEETARMKADGVEIIIALGHSGYQMDKDIARQCLDVDIVIGGHTNTFLYSGMQPDSERIDGPYPTLIKQTSGKEVPVVQAYAYTKYLGKIHIQFDKYGNLIEYDGTPILLNASIPRDNDVLELLDLYRPNITALENSVVGHSKVQLDGRHQVCRKEECNLGNLIADSMVHARILENQGGLYWTDAAIALIMGGGIRSSINKRSDGSITQTDVLTVLPFKNDIYITKISGSGILKVLEHSASTRSRDSNGGFLQMSGIRVTYNFNKMQGERVTSVKVRCSECDVPLYELLKERKVYNVILPEFLLNGGDGYNFNETIKTSNIRLQRNDQMAFIQYLKTHDIVYPELESRITIIEKSVGDLAIALTSSLMNIMLIMFLMIFIN